MTPSPTLAGDAVARLDAAARLILGTRSSRGTGSRMDSSALGGPCRRFAIRTGSMPGFAG